MRSKSQFWRIEGALDVYIALLSSSLELCYSLHIYQYYYCITYCLFNEGKPYSYIIIFL